jgi:hypothetical protein
LQRQHNAGCKYKGKKGLNLQVVDLDENLEEKKVEADLGGIQLIEHRVEEH